MRNAKPILIAMCSCAMFAAMAGCGVSSTNTSAQNQAAVSSDLAQVNTGLAILAQGLAAVSAVPMPSGVATPAVLQQAQYWAQYAAGVSSALSKTVNSTPAQ